MIKLADIKKQKDIVETLAWPFDFDIEAPERDISWVMLEPEFPFKLLAVEGGGGLYLAYGKSLVVENLPILFVSSEGQCGKIANNLEELLSLLVRFAEIFREWKFRGNEEG
ncbi:MAG: hypothetical protein SV201_01140 [Pseudomonadota bacterium]|nr:hypothetical protein [Pseudomonadota bacterium]